MFDAAMPQQPEPMTGKSADMTTKSGMEALINKELRAHGYSYVQPIENSLHTKNRGVFKASGKDKATVAIRVYTLGANINPEHVCAEVLNLSSLHHPHVVQPKSLIRTPHFLCIALEYANGGDVYRLARRAGSSGLPLPAARFIFQQLVLTLAYAHVFGIFLSRINPSNVLVFWNDRGMPILKIADFRLSRPPVKISDRSTPVIGTMYTCPQLIRQADGEADGAAEEAVACAADVWSVCVTLYFLLFSRWPFEKKGIAAWATQPRDLWADDQAIEYPDGHCGLTKLEQAKGRPEDMEEIIALLKKVFAMGKLSVPEFAAECPKIEAIQEMSWFRVDLPDGAAGMKDTYVEKTRERRQSKAYCSLQELLKSAVAPEVTHLSAKMEAASLNDTPVRM